MQKYSMKIVINLIIVLLLIAMPTSIFAVDKSVSIGNDLHFTDLFSAPVSYVNNFAPGDSENHVTKMKNESSVEVALYFIEAYETLSNMNMNKIIFSLYINSVLYKRGNNIALEEKLIYVLAPYEEIEITTNISLDETAGNYYQGKEFYIEWKLGIMEYVEPEEEIIDKPKPIEPPEILEPRQRLDETNTFIIGEIKDDTPKKPETLIVQVTGIIKEKLDGLTGNVNNLIILILVFVAFLVLIELIRGLRWLIIILANLRNTKIYVRVYNVKDEKEFKLIEEDDKKKYKKEKFRIIKENNEEEKYKLVKKIKTKNREEIVLDLDKLAEQYDTDDLKVIFSKNISKKIDKAKIIVHAKDQTFHYDAAYEKKPIEVDVKI